MTCVSTTQTIYVCVSSGLGNMVPLRVVLVVVVSVGVGDTRKSVQP